MFGLRQQLKMTAVSLCCFKSVPKVSYFATNRNIVCALSFLTAALGCLVNLTVNSTSPVPLHLLMRVRVWLAESCSSARRGQSSSGRVEKKWQFMDAGPGLFMYRPFLSGITSSICYCLVMLALVPHLIWYFQPSRHHNSVSWLPVFFLPSILVFCLTFSTSVRMCLCFLFSYLMCVSLILCEI